jgi:hypothetical protein
LLRLDCSAKVALSNGAAHVSLATLSNKARSEVVIKCQPLFFQRFFFVYALFIGLSWTSEVRAFFV